MPNNTLIVEKSPHILAPITTTPIMLGVVACLVPTLIASSVIFGIRALLLTLFTIAACVFFEFAYTTLTKKPTTIKDGSAVVTGLLLAFNLPSILPFWMALIGAFISIVLVKELFGGLGRNFLNPALMGRIVLQISFPQQMAAFTYPNSITSGGVDALANATPLAVSSGESLPLLDMLFGTHAGALGETCILALFLGGAILLFTKIITPAIPFTALGGVFVFKFLLELFRNLISGSNTPIDFEILLYGCFTYILSGGLFLAAFFMATDYTTSPYSTRAKIIYALIFAFFVVVFREFSNMNEGTSYALLLVNLFVPSFNYYCARKPLGAVKKQKKHPLRRCNR